jgi:RNA polymerase sigma factor (sigma-70 family)
MLPEGKDLSPNQLGVFDTTHWSVVMEAGRPDSPQARLALEKLCLAYWHPLYACVRRQGYSPDDSLDLTQEFFARLLENNSVRHADPERGRFRTFLKACLSNFLKKEWVKANAAKRGGGHAHFSLDAQEAEQRFAAETSDDLTPEIVFERRWAATVLESAIKRLAAEYAAAGKEKFFEALKNYTWGDSSADSYADIGREFGVSEGAVKIAALRLRERYRELLRMEVARTVADASQIEDELRYLLQVVSAAAQ